MNTAAAPEAAPAGSTPAPPSLGGLLELIVFLASAVGLYLVVQSTALFALMYAAHRDSPQLARSEMVRQVIERAQYNAFFVVPVQLVFYVLLVLLLYTCVSRRRLPFWSSLAWRPLRWTGGGLAVLAGGLLALLIQFSSALVPPPEQLPFDRLFTSRAAVWLVFAMAVLIAPFVEELVFRGFIYTLLERLWGMTPAVLLSGILFGSIHFPQLYPGYFQMLLLCAVGIVFSVARARTGTVMASILLHLGYNTALTVLFLFSPQFQKLPPG